jgi:uncharacterized membrane protein
MKRSTRRIAFAGILAAVYAVVTYLCLPFAYGSIQFRLSEALAVLCCVTPAAIPGMVMGCIVANIFTTLGFPVIDIVFGSLATLLACCVTRYMSRSLPEKPRMVWLIPLPTILSNALIVGAEIAYFFTEGEAFLPAFGYNALTVGVGEAAVMYILGVPLLFWLMKSEDLGNRLREL